MTTTDYDLAGLPASVGKGWAKNEKPSPDGCVMYQDISDESASGHL